MSLKPEHFEFWIRNNFNVLFVGKHGVGKTSLINKAFELAGLNWKYFSASTMDPWVDFIGVPKEKVEDGRSYLDLVRPKELEDDTLEAIFLDEYNRSHKKVRNAVMELIQFKSINGKKFNNLRMIWAAINPEDDEDEEYDVEKLDPAQADRFHVKVEIPYKPSRAYFTSRYGREMSAAACEWWSQLPKNVKNEVSPRRLDYALETFNLNGDLSYVLPKSSNVGKLIYSLNEGPILEKLNDLCSGKEDPEEFLKSENNYAASIETILKKDKYKKILLPHLEKEKLSSLLSKNYKYMIEASESSEKLRDLIQETISVNSNKAFTKKLLNEIKKQGRNETFGMNVKVANSLTNTYYRQKLFRKIQEQATKHLPPKDAREQLKALDLIASYSQKGTLSAWKMKTVVTKLFSKSNYSDEEMRNLHPNLVSRGQWT